MDPTKEILDLGKESLENGPAAEPAQSLPSPYVEFDGESDPLSPRNWPLRRR